MIEAFKKTIQGREVDPQEVEETLRNVAISEQRRLGLICAEQISMAIANVKLRDQLHDQAIRDTLTGLYNRRYLLETCRREFSRAATRTDGAHSITRRPASRTTTPPRQSWSGLTNGWLRT